MQSLLLPPPVQQAFAKAALHYRFGDTHQPVTEAQILAPRRYEDRQSDLWTVYNRVQESLIKAVWLVARRRGNAAIPAPLRASTAT